ncbi:MAG: oligosaccharide flippase family protein [Lachnospiraceae bacterium]|nr:oligosaccharide flippase family protein [Lachnospiraceae bacterium]
MRVRNSLINIMTGLVGQLIITIAGFVSRTVFINVLGSTYLGVSGLFSNILTLLSFAELGIGQAIIFSLYKPISEQDVNKICALMRLYERVYRFLFGFVLAVGLLLLPALPYIIRDIDNIPNIRIIYVLYVANSALSYLFAYRSSFITACQKNYIINCVSTVCNIVMCVTQVFALVLFRNYFVYLGIQIVFGFIPNVVSYVYSGKLYPFLRKKIVLPLPKNELKKITENVKALVFYKVGTLALNSTDNIIISSFAGIVTVGVYSNYTLLTTTVSGFLSTIFNNLTASIGNLNANESIEKKIFIFKVINLAAFWFYAICSVCLLVCMTPFIHVWIGDEYVLSFSSSIIIALNVYIGGMLFAPFNFRQTMGIFVEGKWRPIISAIINIVVSIIFAKWWGLPGVLWGTAVARLTTNVWFDPYLVFRRGLNTSPRPYFIDYIYKMVAAIMIAVICCFVAQFIPNENIFWIFVKALVTFIISNTVVFLLYFRSEEFRYLFDVVKNFKGIIKK